MKFYCQFSVEVYPKVVVVSGLPLEAYLQTKDIFVEKVKRLAYKASIGDKATIELLKNNNYLITEEILRNQFA